MEWEPQKKQALVSPSVSLWPQRNPATARAARAGGHEVQGRNALDLPSAGLPQTNPTGIQPEGEPGNSKV